MTEVQRPLRIFFVIRYFHPFVGGLEKKVMNLARALSSPGCRITIITSRFSRSWPKEELLSGIEIIRLPSPRIKIAGAILYCSTLFLYLWRQRGSFDIMHCFQVGYSSSCAVTAGRLLGKKSVLTLSSSGSGGDVQRHRRSLWGRFFLHFCLRAFCIVTLHEKMKNEITAHYPAGEIKIIPNGVDPAVYQPSPERAALRLQLGLAPDERMVLYAGRFSAEKGIDFFLRAFKGLQPDKAIRLWLFGDGPERAALQKLIPELGLTGSVRIHCSTDTIASIFQAADLFVMPSRFEGMSNAVLEAMACGVPVVATDVPGNREIIEHNRTGLLVPFGDSGALSRAIKAMLEDAALSRMLSENARKQAISGYSSARAAELHRSLYEELARSTGSVREIPA